MDISGFDELRVAASLQDLGFGNGQAIALDDVRAQIGDITALVVNVAPA